jgi:predicted aspartyl protease
MPYPLRHLFAAVVFFMLSFLPASTCGQQMGFYFEKSRKRASIPFELHNNLIVISAWLNGAHPLNFILDTGVRPTILLDNSFADSIGMTYQREVELFGVGNNPSVKALVSAGVSLSLRQVGSSNLSVLVLEENLMELERHLGAKIDGILGYDFFRRFVVKINYQKMRIDLFEPHDFQPPSNFDMIDLELVESKPFVNLMIHQDSTSRIMANLLVDTGASHALILNPASHAQIVLPEDFIVSNLGRSISGELSGKLGRVDQMTIGSYDLPDVIASYIEGSDVNGVQETVKNGSIGGELLLRFTVIIDYYHKKIYIRPNRAFQQPFEYNMSGLEFIASGENLNRFVINNIRAGSAADQVGFKAGDVLVVLNDIPAKKLSLSRIYSELSLKAGKQVTLTVIRDGAYISRSFRLKKEI